MHDEVGQVVRTHDAPDRQRRPQLGPAALVELTTYVALANLVSRSNVAMGIESQEFSASCDLEPLALASTT